MHLIKNPDSFQKSTQKSPNRMISQNTFLGFPSAQIGRGLRHSAVRTLSFRATEGALGQNTSGRYSTKVIGNRLGKASAFELHCK